MPVERLQKILAAAGLGSRRSCEKLITDGRVSVDGIFVTELGTKADPDRQEIRCDGEIVRPARPVYYLVNKPRGLVSTNEDELGRQRVIDLLPSHDQRLFTVGRLDADTEGLLIVTNDGDFAQRIAHPRYGVGKTYRAKVHGAFSTAAKQELLSGVWVIGNLCKATWVKLIKRGRSDSLVEITMHEGRNREVRRMLSKVGFPVMNLRRVKIGPLEDESLKLGRWRKLRPEEITMLLGAASKPGPTPPRSKQRNRHHDANRKRSARPGDAGSSRRGRRREN